MKNQTFHKSETINLSSTIITFNKAFNNIKQIHFESIDFLEKNHNTYWNQYASSTKKIIKIILYSTKLITSKKNNENGELITTCNSAMVKSLRDSGFMNYYITEDYFEDEVLEEIFAHIIMKTTYIFKQSTDSKEAYNLISRCVTNKLIDMIRKMKKWKRDFLLQNNTTNTNTGAIITYADVDSHINIEEDYEKASILELIRNELIFEIVNTLLSHPDRLLSYLSDYANHSCNKLLSDINTYGYQFALASIISKLKDNTCIDFSYLQTKNLVFKKDCALITKSDIYNWQHRAYNDIKPVIEKFKSKNGL